jgi:hypothetical protein
MKPLLVERILRPQPERPGPRPPEGRRETKRDFASRLSCSSAIVHWQPLWTDVRARAGAARGCDPTSLGSGGRGPGTRPGFSQSSARTFAGTPGDSRAAGIAGRRPGFPSRPGLDGGVTGDADAALSRAGVNGSGPAAVTPAFLGRPSAQSPGPAAWGVSRGAPEFSRNRPQVGRDYPLNLSISLSGGKENKGDSPSNGERTGKPKPSAESPAPRGSREMWRMGDPHFPPAGRQPKSVGTRPVALLPERVTGPCGGARRRGSRQGPSRVELLASAALSRW